MARLFGIKPECLRNYLRRHHPDLIPERDRIQQLLGKSKRPPRGMNRQCAERYAKAMELYRASALTATEVAIQCEVDPGAFMQHLNRWHKSDVGIHKKLQAERAEQRRQKRLQRQKGSRVARATAKYAPAVALIEGGATYKEAAAQTGISNECLQRWVRQHNPSLHEQAKQQAWVPLPNGTRVSRRLWDQLEEAAHCFRHTDEPLKHIARRLKIPLSSPQRFLYENYPDVVLSRRQKRKG